MHKKSFNVSQALIHTTLCLIITLMLCFIFIPSLFPLLKHIGQISTKIPVCIILFNAHPLEIMKCNNQALGN